MPRTCLRWLGSHRLNQPGACWSTHGVYLLHSEFFGFHFSLRLPAQAVAQPDRRKYPILFGSSPCWKPSWIGAGLLSGWV